MSKVVKYFSCKDRESRTEILWSLSSADANPKPSNAGSVEASFTDEYALASWADTHRKWFGYVPSEVDVPELNITTNMNAFNIKHRFVRDIYLDGHPIIDTKTCMRYGNFNKDLLTEILNELAEKAERATPIENGKNRYGLDVSYFRSLINRELNRALVDHKPSELARVCARIAKAADSSVLLEPEFTGEE